MNKFKYLALILALVLSLGLFTACKPKNKTNGVVDLTGVSGDGAEVSMSVLYNNQQTMMRYDSTYVPYNSLNGEKYQQKNWKPAWAQLQKDLNFKIKDVTQEKASSVSQAFDLLLANNFKGVNILSGPVSSIVEQGTTKDTLVDLTKYQQYLPNFFKFVNDEENKIVKMSITSANGAIYYAPYFDGLDDIETMFICRVDWVQKLLDDKVYRFVNGEAQEEANTPTYDTDTELTVKYEGYYDTMDTTFKAMKNRTETQDVTVKYNADQGIIARQNKLDKKNGQTLTEELIKYINENYVSKGYISKPSELFVGQNACYNADELIALWRCVKTNPKLLSGASEVIPFYPRAKTMDRANQVLQLAQLWGVRGYESRNGYFYFDKNGKLADARESEDMMEALTFLHQLYEEGLICRDYSTGLSSGTEEYRDTFNKQNLGFMTYDYNQTTTIYNETINDRQTPYRNLSPILFPVADWDNKATPVSGKSGAYSVSGNVLYQYTESWRSVKSEGWAITTGTTQNKEVFKKCLEIFDYMYTDAGQILMTYGPKEWIEHDESGNVVYTDYYGEQVPKISTAAIKELKDPALGKGNYTNYYRFYVGSTLPIGFVKHQGMEYQTADPKGLIGLDYIGYARKAGVLKHATLTKNEENIQNTLVPTTFALTKQQTDTVANTCATLGTQFNNSSSGQNIFHNYVVNGFGVAGMTLSKEALLEQIKTTWQLNAYVNLHNVAYSAMNK